jgi:hypothetical protein
MKSKKQKAAGEDFLHSWLYVNGYTRITTIEAFTPIDDL